MASELIEIDRLKNRVSQLENKVGSLMRELDDAENRIRKLEQNAQTSSTFYRE